MSDATVAVVAFGVPGIDDDLPDAAGANARPLVGLYFPPWEACLAAAPAEAAGSDDWTVDWLAWHQALVALYESAPGRVHLVNAGRVRSPDLLAAHLAEAGLAWPAGIELPQLAPADEPAARLLASAMAEFARPLWDQYQVLESCAALLDREPEFLGTVGIPDLAKNDEVLAVLREVQAHARDAVETASACDIAASARAAALDAALAGELRQENELLGMQLQQLHEELRFHVESGKQLRQALAEAEVVATSARRMLSSLASGGTVPG